MTNDEGNFDDPLPWYVPNPREEEDGLMLSDGAVSSRPIVEKIENIKISLSPSILMIYGCVVEQTL